MKAQGWGPSAANPDQEQEPIGSGGKCRAKSYLPVTHEIMLRRLQIVLIDAFHMPHSTRPPCKHFVEHGMGVPLTGGRETVPRPLLWRRASQQRIYHPGPGEKARCPAAAAHRRYMVIGKAESPLPTPPACNLGEGARLRESFRARAGKRSPASPAPPPMDRRRLLGCYGLALQKYRNPHGLRHRARPVAGFTSGEQKREATWGRTVVTQAVRPQNPSLFLINPSAPFLSARLQPPRAIACLAREFATVRVGDSPR